MQPVSRHERGVTVPPLSVALAYASIFRVEVIDLFPVIAEAVERDVEARLGSLESRLGRKSAKDRDKNATACKLQFIALRKCGIQL